MRTYTVRTTDRYDSNSFIVATWTTNYDCKANWWAFGNVPNSLFVWLRSDAAISIKLNSTDNDSIALWLEDMPFESTNIKVSNVYITNNSWSNATINLFNA